MYKTQYTHLERERERDTDVRTFVSLFYSQCSLTVVLQVSSSRTCSNNKQQQELFTDATQEMTALRIHG